MKNLKLQIIKPPKQGKHFITVAPNGYSFFSSKASEELGITENKGILLSQDEEGYLYIQIAAKTNPEAFRVIKRKNGLVFIYLMKTNIIFKRLGIVVKSSTRFDLEEVDSEESDIYKIVGLKTVQNEKVFSKDI